MSDWQARFPELAAEGGADLVALLDSAPVVALDAGQLLFDRGSPSHAFLMVLDGRLAVRLLGDNGRLVTLYRVASGEFCVLTTICLLGRSRLPAAGVAESPIAALALKAEAFELGLEHSPRFRRFVFEGLGQRLVQVIRRMESVTFGAIDQRLAATLPRFASPSGAVELTHEALAVELGTAREVVSRHLKRLEARGWLALRRGRIEVLDAQALQRLAQAALCDPISDAEDDLDEDGCS